MFARGRDPLDHIRSLAHTGSSALAVVEIVARRFESEVPAPLREADSLLRTIHSELVGLITTPTVELDMGGGWALDRGWRAAVLGVASTRPRVLLTVGANALRSLDEM